MSLLFRLSVGHQSALEPAKTGAEWCGGAAEVGGQSVPVTELITAHTPPRRSPPRPRERRTN